MLAMWISEGLFFWEEESKEKTQGRVHPGVSQEYQRSLWLEQRQNVGE